MTKNHYIRTGIALCAVVFLAIPRLISELDVSLPLVLVTEKQEVPAPPPQIFTMLFVGDIFLGRAVERLTEEYGDHYPFLKTADLIRNADIAVGNFEGSVPEIHVPTPSMGFVFSINTRFFPILEATGFDILSLANNHAYDYGFAGFTHTRTVCAETDIVCTGHPHNLPEYATTSVLLGTTTVGILSIHALVSLENSELIASVQSMEQNEMNIAYIHWGTEYERIHSQSQETLAHLLIDAGIDAVIGHHPHVVQDIEVYKDRPIFYSLGNFVFDQYFSEDVMRGIGVNLTISDTTLTYAVIPFESATLRSQPRVLEDTARETFISGLTVTKEGTSTTTIDGVFSFPRR